MQQAPRGTRWLRAAAGALAAVFALPSCFTMAMWRDPGRKETQRVAARVAAVSPGAQQFFVAPRGLSPEVRALWQPPLPDGAWLLVEPQAHGASVERLLQERPQNCELLVCADQSAAGTDPDAQAGAATRAPRVLFCWRPTGLAADDSLRSLDGVEPRRSVFDSPHLEVACAATPIPAQPGGESQPFAVAVYESNLPTLARVGLTPITVAVDVVLSPLELLTLPAWW